MRRARRRSFLGIVAAGGQERRDADRGGDGRLGTLDATRAEGERERAEQVVLATQRRCARTAPAGVRLLDRGEERRDARREDHGGRAPRGRPWRTSTIAHTRVCRHDDASVMRGLDCSVLFLGARSPRSTRSSSKPEASFTTGERGQLPLF